MQRIDKIRNRQRVSRAYPQPELKPKPTVALRLGGIYTLPDGKELIVGVGRESRYFLYHPLAWKVRAYIVSLPIEYEIDAQGPVITGRGQPASWRIEDLIDTGRSVD
jgi:hypothetical protein